MNRLNRCDKEGPTKWGDSLLLGYEKAPPLQRKEGLTSWNKYDKLLVD